MLWLKIAELIRSLLVKFTAQKCLFESGTPIWDKDNFKINVGSRSACKNESLIDVETKAKTLFHDNLIEEEYEEQF